MKKISELIDEYERGGRLRGITVSQSKALRPIRAALGELEPPGLTTAVVEKYVEDRRAGLFTRAAAHGAQTANGTIRRELSALVSVLNWSERKQLIPPAPAIDLPPPSPPREVFLSRHEADRLFEYGAQRAMLGSKVGLFSCIALDTWARSGAIEALPWTRIDLEREQIDYRDPSMTETVKRRVPVPISPRLMPVLDGAWDRWLKDKPGTPTVVGPITQYTWKTFLGNALPERPELTRHDLRRTGISLALARGVEPLKVAQMAGDDLATILKHYARFMPDYLTDVWADKKLAA
jgi:integrase